MEGDKLTLSVIKADIGGYVGHSSCHPRVLEAAQDALQDAVARGLLIDGQALHCGDDVQLIMTHRRGVEDTEIHRFAWNTFEQLTELAREMKLYGAGQDLLADTFSGNIKGMGPGVAELSFVERPSEPVVIFMADKTSPGAWNLPLFKIFADPFNTIGLVIDPSMHRGFRFQVLDVIEHKTWLLSCPEDMYDLLVLIGAPGRYLIEAIYRKKDGEIGAVASTQKLGLLAGRYIGKDDPVLIVRSQSGFPALGEILETFAFPHLVEGWMRGSHHGPIMPVAFKDANPSRFDGPPRVIAAGYQLCHGKLIGPRDLFDDPSFDEARRQANLVADYMRRHGPFQPHRLHLQDMEYTTLPQVMAFIFTKSVLPRRAELEAQIQQKYPELREVRVVDPGLRDYDAIEKSIAREAAHYLEKIIASGIRVAISGGRTLYSMITFLEPGKFSGIKLYPLSMTPIFTMPGLTANALVSMMGTKYPEATAYNLPSHPVASRQEYEQQLMSTPETFDIYKDIWEAEIMFVGIGSVQVRSPGFIALASQELGLSAAQLADLGIVAEINHNPIGADGEPLTTFEDPALQTLSQRMIGVSPMELRERAARPDRYVVGVAGGQEKIEAIRAVLKGKYLNVLITDAYVAEALLKE
ncbi:MAG: fructose 1,6-bisphosphatase [Deltaproteobacteria bacterium]|nr:fructose 1,6-bisphosphatase [Deltaproteobacteria bacterium]